MTQYDLFVAPQVSEEWTRGRSRRLPIPPTPREVVSLHSDYNPTPKGEYPREFSRWCRGAADIASGTRRDNSWQGNPDERGQIPIQGGSRNEELGATSKRVESLEARINFINVYVSSASIPAIYKKKEGGAR